MAIKKLTGCKYKRKEKYILTISKDEKNMAELKKIISIAIEEIKREVRYKTKLEDALSMKKKNYSIKEISEITGLDVADIEVL